MSSSSFLTPGSAASATCNGSGGLMVPGGGGGGLGGGGGGGGLLTVSGGGNTGGGNLYAAIGRKPTPMLARKNTPTESEVKTTAKHAQSSFESSSDYGNKSRITTTSSSTSSSTVVKLPAISTTHNNMTQGNIRPNKVEVQPVGNTKTDKTHKQESNQQLRNNNDSSKSKKKKNVSFGDAHVVDDSWITDKWCKRGLSIHAIRMSLRKRFRRNRNMVSNDKQCSPEEPTEQEAEQKLPQKKPPVQLAPILKTTRSPNPPIGTGSNPEFTTTMNSLHNTNANLR